ncbi:FMN-dependent NADH-azoreductase [Olivibacter ginsenosidimutans]|uniref:FMN dependent NADH:quinone oxidoreductase n=1 Tax=Olivibacter ginsenosidimutans TaxID=1176537 RepID=A0ABP9BT50_9SPHI
MKKILHVISSPRGKNSCSIQLAEAIIEKLTRTYHDVSVIERDLLKEPPPFLSDRQIAAFYKPSDQLNQEERDILSYSDKAVEEIQEAQLLVIGIPMYNLGIPAILKAWIDQIVRIVVPPKSSNGKSALRTFKNKKVYLAIASGRIHSTAGTLDFIEPYVKHVLQTIGITNLCTFKTEGTAQRIITSTDYRKLIDRL